MVNPSRSPTGHPPLPTDSPNPSSTTSQTPLPSIRQLHPYLPPSGASRFETDTYGNAGDSENEDVDPQGPPKKKRRRQALSCTECKRRKIKCDRNQPCAPCTRRGEQAKCQWHVVEHVEKYVSRAEYDELKLRFEHLENTVHRLMGINSGEISELSFLGSASGDSSSGTGSAGAPLAIPAAAGPDYQPGNQGPSTGYGIVATIGEQPFSASQNIAGAIRSNAPTHHSTTSLDTKRSPSQQMMLPPKFLNQPSTASAYDSGSATHHQQEPVGPSSPSTPLFSSRRSQTHARQSSRSSVGSVGSMRSPIIPHSSSGMSGANSPAPQYRTLPNESPLLTAASPSIMKNSPLSLAAITSPFDREPGLLSRSGVDPSDSEVLTSTSSTSSSLIPQSKVSVSPTFSQPKNFYAQTLWLGERLRKLTLVIPLRHKPRTFLLYFTNILFTLLILHALMTHMSTHHFLPAQFITAVLSVVKSTSLIAALVPQGQTEEGSATLHHLRYYLPKQRWFMPNRPEQAIPGYLKARSLTRSRQASILYLLLFFGALASVTQFFFSKAKWCHTCLHPYECSEVLVSDEWRCYRCRLRIGLDRHLGLIEIVKLGELERMNPQPSIREAACLRDIDIKIRGSSTIA
ncbi:hypothetical protein DFH05DRAFT_1455237 [Lentinula detonsa]|uniref:Zn(2)-C6 fungal-type domain-containing protein n=1 Tax=Lentinula detonsa TaxID=2804962 RepID=A0A9W8PAA0_9AGAR|nr:hypothetical protein DFH05DRAFT_1455237 [Lentinula detonsa]